MIATFAGPRPGMIRSALTALMALALSACAGIVPRSEPPPPPPETAPPITGPSSTTLPDADEDRHRVALLVPLSGTNAGVGQGIANATTMALLDTNASNLRITTYDTATGAAAAASRAIADGNRLILGPLLSDNIDAVKAVAGPARVPLISFSNDSQAAGDGVFVMGQIPAQSIERTLRYAAQHGVKNVAGLVPSGEYGRRASAALIEVARATGLRVSAIETYDRSNAALASAVTRLSQNGAYDAVLIADGSRMAVRAAPMIRERAARARLLGTELWSGESQVAQSPALRGAWFSAIADDRFAQFSESYRSRFGSQPHRISTLGYDAVLLAIRTAQDWQVGDRFPVSELEDDAGFIGLDGAFRFDDDGRIQRMFEVREVTGSGVKVVSPAGARFDN